MSKINFNARSQITLADLAEFFDADNAPHRVRSQWRVMLRELGPETLISDIDTPRLTRWVMANRRRWKPGTINRRLNFIRAKLATAADLGLIEAAPRCRLLREDNARDRIASRGEVDQITQNLPPPIGLAVWIAYFSAMRRGEICKITWSQVDLSAGLVRLHARQTKTRKARSVPLCGELRRLMAEHRAPASCRVVEREPETITQRFGRRVRELGIHDLRFHDLRHTALTNLRRAGCDLFVLQRIAGHASLAMAQRYQFVDDRDLLDAVAKLSAGYDR